MRKFILTLLAVSILGLGGAFGQIVETDADFAEDYWAGISFGFPFGVNFHFGADDIISESLDLRATASAGFDGIFGLGADALFDIPVDTDDVPVDVYAGGGFAVSFGDIDETVAGSETAFDIHFMFGGEYRLVEAGLPSGGVFAEVGPAINFGAGSNFGVNAKLGFNYHF